MPYDLESFDRKCIVCHQHNFYSHLYYMDYNKDHPYLVNNLEFLEWKSER